MGLVGVTDETHLTVELDDIQKNVIPFVLMTTAMERFLSSMYELLSVLYSVRLIILDSIQSC